MSGFKPGGLGSGPGGVLPASLGIGDLLIGDGLNAWSANPNLPVVGPGGVGSVLWWDGTSRYRYSAAPTDGQVMQWDAGTNLWVPVTLQTQMYGFGALGTAGGVAASWLFPGFGTIAAPTTEPNAGSDTITRDGILRNFFVRHGNPGGVAGNINYVLRINGADVLTLVLAATSAGPASDLVTQIAVVQGDRVSMRMDHAVGVGTSQRMRWNCEFTT